MRIAVDIMGSDNFPKPDVAGAVQAAQAWGDTLYLVGDQALIENELAQHNTQGLDLRIEHTSEYITMNDQPSQVGKSKPNSSFHRACDLLEQGKAEAVVTAGNTGAALAITTLYKIKRITGVKRPSLAAIVPLPLQHKHFLMTDIGANTDCRPEWMIQFAAMGSLYMEKVYHVQQPKIGLLSNGEEDIKGNQLIRETHELLKKSHFNYVGHVEPKEVMAGGVDVMICDGLVGNVFMKTIESVLTNMQLLIRHELYSSWQSKLGALLARPAFKRMGRKLDPFEIGGTILLGINGVVIIAHGRTNALGIKNSIRMAREAIEQDLILTYREQLSTRQSE